MDLPRLPLDAGRRGGRPSPADADPTQRSAQLLSLSQDRRRLQLHLPKHRQARAAGLGAVTRLCHRRAEPDLPRQAGTREDTPRGRDRLPRDPKRLRRPLRTAAELIEDLSVASHDSQLAMRSCATSRLTYSSSKVGYLTYGEDAANVSPCRHERHRARRPMVFTSNKPPESGAGPPRRRPRRGHHRSGARARPAAAAGRPLDAHAAPRA